MVARRVRVVARREEGVRMPVVFIVMTGWWMFWLLSSGGMGGWVDGWCWVWRGYVSIGKVDINVGEKGG